MDIEELREKATTLHNLATEVVASTGIVEVFKGLGEVNFVGSYVLDTMFRPDIDMAIISEAPSLGKSIEVTKKLLDCHKFQTVGFANWFDYQAKNLRRGYYWELIHVFDKFHWKLDVWYSDRSEDDSIEPTQRHKRLLEQNPAARDTILLLKQKFFDGTKYKDRVNGNRIYRAVLENGVVDSEGLVKFVDGLEKRIAWGKGKF